MSLLFNAVKASGIGSKTFAAAKVQQKNDTCKFLCHFFVFCQSVPPPLEPVTLSSFGLVFLPNSIPAAKVLLFFDMCKFMRKKHKNKERTCVRAFLIILSSKIIEPDVCIIDS